MVSTSGAVECPACCRWCCRRDCRLDVWNRKDFGSCISTSMRLRPFFCSNSFYSNLAVLYIFIVISLLIFIIVLLIFIMRLYICTYIYDYTYIMRLLVRTVLQFLTLWILWILKITLRINFKFKCLNNVDTKGNEHRQSVCKLNLRSIPCGLEMNWTFKSNCRFKLAIVLVEISSCNSECSKICWKAQWKFCAR